MNKLKAIDICTKYNSLSRDEKYLFTYGNDFNLECHYKLNHREFQDPDYMVFFDIPAELQQSMMDDENAFWDDQVALFLNEQQLCKAIYDDSQFSSNEFVRYIVYNNTEVNPDYKTFSKEEYTR